MQDFLKLEITKASELREWLTVNHTQNDSIWLVTYKKIVPEKFIPHSEILDELLCFGWIDGRLMKIDDEKVMQLISPRRVQHWSKTYKDRFARLESEGKMTDIGRKSVQESKKAGLWDFMDDVDALIQPQDFIDELAKFEEAIQNWNNFNPSSQRFMLRYIKIAKTSATRIKRIVTIAELASRNRKLPGS